MTENGADTTVRLQPRTKLSLVFDGANAMRTSKKGMKPVKAMGKKAGPKQTGSSKLQSAQSGSDQDDDYVPRPHQRQDSELSDGSGIDQGAVSEGSHIRQARTDAVSETSCDGLDTLTLHEPSEQALTSVRQKKRKVVSSTCSESDGDPGKMRQVGSVASLSISNPRHPKLEVKPALQTGKVKQSTRYPGC